MLCPFFEHRISDVDEVSPQTQFAFGRFARVLLPERTAARIAWVSKRRLPFFFKRFVQSGETRNGEVNFTAHFYELRQQRYSIHFDRLEFCRQGSDCLE